MVNHMSSGGLLVLTAGENLKSSEKIDEILRNICQNIPKKSLRFPILETSAAEGFSDAMLECSEFSGCHRRICSQGRVILCKIANRGYKLSGGTRRTPDHHAATHAC